jgi:hypothetical protein
LTATPGPEGYVAERMIEANGVELCTESFGDPTDSPVLLVMGIGGSWRPPERRVVGGCGDGGDRRSATSDTSVRPQHRRVHGHSHPHRTSGR